MARSTKSDPVEKFRFRVSVISFDPSLTGAVESISGFDNLFNIGSSDISRNLAVISRAGFSEVTLPQATVSEISYRENTDNQRFMKMPGLVKYENITLKRGVTKNRDLYDWFRLVNEEIALLTTSQELTGDSKYAPSQNDLFRKDVVIEVLDREGVPVKSWYVFNAWPSKYKGGNDLSANSEEKLMEEVTLSYENFIELEGGIEGLAKEVIKNVFFITLDARLPGGRF